MDFSSALSLIKTGLRMGRTSWKNSQYVFLVPGSTFNVNRPPLMGVFPEGTQVTYNAHIDVMNTNGSVSTWAPSNTDVLAEDWYEYE